METVRFKDKVGFLLKKQIDEYQKKNNVKQSTAATKLHISSSIGIFLPEELDYIENLIIDEEWTVNDLQNLKYFKNLKSLEVKNQDNFTIEQLNEIMSTNKNINNLSLINLFKIRRIDLSVFMNLEFLEITSNQNLKTINGISRLQNLKHCSIYDNDNLSNYESISTEIIKIIEKCYSNNIYSSLPTFDLDVMMYPEMQKK